MAKKIPGIIKTQFDSIVHKAAGTKNKKILNVTGRYSKKDTMGYYASIVFLR
jgi:hypothetical protein